MVNNLSLSYRPISCRIPRCKERERERERDEKEPEKLLLSVMCVKKTTSEIEKRFGLQNSIA
jgi:hypothetical protein